MRALLMVAALSAYAQHWEPLFDGKSADGWVEVTGKSFPGECWRIEDGCLRALPSTDGRQDIRTIRTFRDFELSFEWKIAAKGNSGVKYLVQRIDEWQPRGGAGMQARARGFEYQLFDGAEGGDPTRTTASLYSVLSPSQSAPKPAGEFNASRIVVRGELVEHWLNGAKVLEYRLADDKVAALAKSLCRGAPFTRESPISLQNHNSDVWFRNIRIRRF